MNTKIINVVKCFGRDCRMWTNDKEINGLAINKILEYCYWKFRNRGFLFLNEVYQEFGMPMTKQGQVAGWVFGKEHENDHMWTTWTKDDEDSDVYITFEHLEDITYILPEE